jgi:hypothetical protein
MIKMAAPRGVAVFNGRKARLRGGAQAPSSIDVIL